MGSQTSIDQQFINNNTTQPYKWRQIKNLEQIFYRNPQLEVQYELRHILTSVKLKLMFKQRIKLEIPFIPRIVFVKEQKQSLDCLVQNGTVNIQNFLRKMKKSPVQLVKQYYKGIILALNQLRMIFGCFFITENMIKVNYAGKLLVWINEDYAKMEPQFPLPDIQGQQAMIWKINKFFKHSQEIYKIPSYNTFGKILQEIQRYSKFSENIQSTETSVQQEKFNLNLSSQFFSANPKLQNSCDPFIYMGRTENIFSKAQNFGLQLMQLDEIQSRSSFVSIYSADQSEKIGSIIKKKCKEKHKEEKKQQRQSQLKNEKTNKPQQLHDPFFRAKQNRSRTYDVENQKTQQANQFIYGDQKQCNSPLKRQISLQLQKIFSC